MDEVGSALVAIALVLCAVFVPSVFITGISGQFYRQFALTIAGATVISLIVSLTLSPAMCALLLKPHDRGAPRPLVGAADPRLLRLFQSRASTGVAAGISWLATRTVRRAAIMVVVYLVVLGVGLNAFRKTPVGFIPQVDRRLPHRRRAAAAGRFAGAHRRGAAARARHRARRAGRGARGQHRRLLRRHLHQRAQFRRAVSGAGRRSRSAPAIRASRRRDPGRAEPAAVGRSRTPSSSRCCRRRCAASAPPAASA